MGYRWVSQIINTARNRPSSPKGGRSALSRDTEIVSPAVIVEPDTGIIAAGTTEAFTFVYRPSYVAPNFYEFRLALEGGVLPSHSSATVVTAHGELIACAIAPIDKMIDFGKFGVGLKRVVTVTLRNSGSTAGVFYVQHDSIPQYVKVTPMVARIESGESIDLLVTLSPNEEYILDPNFAALAITVRGGKPLLIPLSAVVIMPDVVIDGDFEFGGVIVGSVARRRITLINKSDIHTELAVDFRAYAPHWRITPPRPTGDDDNMSVGDQSILRYDFDGWEMPGAVAGGSPKKGDGNASESDDDDVDDDDSANDDIDEEDFSDLLEDDEGLVRSLPSRFILKLNPGAVLMFDLVFKPTVASPEEGFSFDFMLPVSLFTTIEVPLEGLRRHVAGFGLEPRIRIESPLIDFGSRPFPAEPERRVPYSLSLRIYNTCPRSEPVSWFADKSNLAQYFPGQPGSTRIFDISPDRGIIAPGRSETVQVSFFPCVADRTFINTIPLHLEGGDGGEPNAPPYLELEVTGKGIPLQLSFDRREVILPPVPLGVTARATFWVINTGFDYLELQVRIPANEITAAVGVPLTVSFPNGQILSAAHERLPVVVEFHALQAMAFTVTVELSDATTGKKWGMPVTGSADNCLFSNFSYVHANRGAPLYIECIPGEAPQLVPEEKSSNDAPGILSRGPAGSPGSPFKGEAGRRGKSYTAVKAEELKSQAAPPKRDRVVTKPPLEMSARSERLAVTKVVAPLIALNMEMPIAYAESTDVYTAFGRAALPDDLLQAGTHSGRAFRAAIIAAASGKRATHNHHQAQGAAAKALFDLRASAIADADSLVRWLNVSGVLAKPIQSWPNDVVAANGRPIFDLIELLSSRLIPGRLRVVDESRLPNSRTRRAQAFFKQAQDVINILKAQGAHVHAVRPEALLDQESFLLARKYIPRGVLFGSLNYAAPMLDPVGGSKAKRTAESRLKAAFPVISCDAWTVLTLQVLKLFGLGRVNLRALILATPGLAIDPANGALWAAMRTAEGNIGTEIKRQRTNVVAIKSGAILSSGGSNLPVPMLQLPPPPRPSDRDSNNSVSGRSISGRTGSIQGRAPTYVDPESTEALVAEKKKPRLKAVFEPSIILDEGISEVDIIPSSRRSIKGSIKGGSGSLGSITGSHARGGQGSIAGSRAGGNGGGMGAASVAGSFVGTVIGTMTGGRHERFSKGAVHDPLTLKVVDAVILSKAATIHEKMKVFLTPDHALVTSNVYSSAENLLLRWLAWHYNRMFQAMTLPAARARGIHVSARAAEPRRFVCFERDIADGSALIHLILSHAPELGKPGRPLDASVGLIHLGPGELTSSQGRDNATAIMKALAELNLEPPFRAEDLGANAFDVTTSTSATDNAYDGAETMVLMMNAIKASAGLHPKKAGKDAVDNNDEVLYYDQPPELTTELLVRSDVTVRPLCPLFDDGHGVIKGTAPGTDLLRLRNQVLPVPGASSSTSAANDSPRARDNVLTLLWFFNVLPPQIPRAVVDFKCALGMPTTKTIVLSNPTKRPIEYAVYIEQDPAGGARPTQHVGKEAPAAAQSSGNESLREMLDHDPMNDFKPPPPVWALSATRVRVNAESTARFPVTATPAFSMPSHAKVRFVATRRLGGLAPSILTFALRTIVTTRPPRSVVTVRAPTYEGIPFDIDISNPTLTDSLFHVFVIPMAPDAPYGQNLPASIISDLLASNPNTFAASNSVEVSAATALANDVRLGLCKAPTIHAFMDLSSGSVGPKNERSASEFLVTGWRSAEATLEAETAFATETARPRPKKAMNAVSEAPQQSSARLGIPTTVEQESASIRLPSYLLPNFSVSRHDVLAAYAKAQEAAAVETAVLMAKRASNGGVDPDEGPDFEEYEKAVVAETSPQDFPVERRAILSHLTFAQEQAVGRSRTPAGKPIPAPSFICRYTNVHLPARDLHSHTKRLPLQFMPMSPGSHRAAVVLIDAHSSIAELVFEINATADDPNVIASMHARAPLAKEIEKCIKLPPVNSAFENARDDLLLRIVTEMRPVEIEMRSHDRKDEAQARETALRILRKSHRASHPLKAERPGNGSMMWSKSDAGVNPRVPRSELSTNAKIAATLILGTQYKVHLDSPFFSAPKTVYIPASLTILPPVGAGNAGAREQGSIGSSNVDGGLSVLSRVNVATLIEPILTDLPGIAGSAPGTASISAMAPSQAAVFKGNNAPVFFKPIAAPLAVADALGEGSPDSLRGLGQLPLTLSPRGAGIYMTRVILTSDRDTRVYEVSMTVDDPGPSKSLQMAAPLGGFVTQTIPITNYPASGPRAAPPSVWMLKPMIHGVGRSSHDHAGNALPLHFTITPDLIQVPVNGVSCVTVEWRPILEGDELAQLELVPAPGFMSSAAEAGVPPLLYDLHGIGEPPLALSTISLRTHTRGNVKATIDVPSPLIPGPASVAITLRVKCSIPGMIIPQTVHVPAPGEGTAPMMIEWSPPRAGTFTGTLTVEDSRTGRYVWWAINCVAVAPEPHGHLALSTKVRSAVAADVEIANPSLDKPLCLDVSLSGSGLLGPAVFIVPPGASRTLEIIYAPFFPTQGTVAGQLTMTPVKRKENDDDDSELVRGAEIVYALELTATEAESITVPHLNAPLSGKAVTTVVIENSTGATASVHAVILESFPTPRGVFAIDISNATVTNSNVVDNNTKVNTSNGILSIPPFSSLNVPVIFTPSSLGITQNSTLTFDSPTLGQWNFNLRGSGAAPIASQVTNFAAVMGDTLSASIDFRNPFDVPVQINIQLFVAPESLSHAAALMREASPGATLGSSAPLLKLLLGTNGTSASSIIAARSTVPIPFAFVPPALLLARAEIRITVNLPETRDGMRVSPLVWVFPIRCIGEAKLGKEIQLRGAARRTATVNFSVPLPGLSLRSSGAPLTVTLTPISHDFHDVIARGGSTLLSGLGTSASTVTIQSKGNTTLLGGEGRSTSGGGGGGVYSDIEAVSLDELSRAVTIVPARLVFGAPGENLQLAAQIHAMRPLAVTAELTISRADGIGGRWRVPIRIVIVAAPPDDELIVLANMHTTGSHSFSLTNPFPHSAPFTASFSLETPVELSISPSSGVLPASSAAAVARGTGSDAPTSSTLTVYFHPKDYSQQVKGLLTVQTDEFQWTFRVIGRIPDALPPDSNHISSTIDDHLSQRSRDALRASKTTAKRAQR